MTQPVKITLSFELGLEQAPAFLQQLLTALPAAAGFPASSTDQWPCIPPSAGDAYREEAEENLRRLRSGDIPDDGWTKVPNLPDVIDSLRAETRRVLMRAIENGGHVSRAEVFTILERNKDQSLKGFTKPAASVTERLMAEGILPRDARPLLTPIYTQSKTYQQAQGFTVPLQVVARMARQA